MFLKQKKSEKIDNDKSKMTTKFGAKMYHILVLMYIVFKMSYSVKLICSIGKESKMCSCSERQGKYVL